jgi:hypothetical protein
VASGLVAIAIVVSAVNASTVLSPCSALVQNIAASITVEGVAVTVKVPD